MPLTTIHASPPLDSFTTLAEHQSHTPATFYGAKPVLHYHAIGIRALTVADQASKLPIFATPTPSTTGTEASGENGACIEEVNAFINSENLTLFNPSASIGISIPYPAISLHAIQRLQDPNDSTKEVQGLYMQLELSDPYGVNDDDEPEVVEVTLIPGRTAEGINIQALFEAASNCSNLHPDPADQDDEDMADGDDGRIIFEGSVGYEGISGLPGVQRGTEDGGLPPPFPGSGGWITAENVLEYFNEDGNWIGGEDGPSLGGGAGRIRTRDEVDNGGVNGHAEDPSDESKRPRTD